MQIVEKISSYFIIFILACGLVVFIKAINFTIPLAITTTTRTTEMAVVGERKVEAVPDIFYVSAGITVNNVSTSEEAQKQITEINNKIILALKDLNIQKDNIKTSNYSINPNNKYENGEYKISGYNGNASLEIKVRDKDMTSKAIAAVTNTGANNVRVSRATVEKPEKYREQARSKAITNAKEQAEKLSSELGISLGRVVNMVESTPGNYSPRYDSVSLSLPRSGGGAIEPDIEPGSQTITSTVTLYFEKK